MIIHHPDRGTFHSIETLITRQVGQFWKAHPGQFSKAPKDLLILKGLHPDASPKSFLFQNDHGGFIDADQFRKRVLRKLVEDLELPKLTFQVIRRPIATLAQKKGTVKDVQGLLRHSRAATTTDVYMQEIPESVRATVTSINDELRM